MSTTTTRLALTKPAGTESYDVGIVNANSDKLDGAAGAVGITSTTRPGSPFAGQLIRETDTGMLKWWDSSGTPQWRDASQVPRDRGTGTTVPATDLRRGDVYFHTGQDCLFVYTGTAWKQATIPSSSSGTAGLHDEQLRLHPTYGLQRSATGVWVQVAPYTLSVHGQSIGSVATSGGAGVTVVVTLPGGKAMPSSTYVVNARARENLAGFGSAIIRTHETLSTSTTQFSVRVEHTFGSALSCVIDYTCTTVTP